MEAELKNLKIDRSRKGAGTGSTLVRRIVLGAGLLAMLGAGGFLCARWNAAPEVEVLRVHASGSTSGSAEADVLLNATGYIVAAHKIQLAAKVVGRVAWIGVDKGDKVQHGQVLVRLEDDEYRAHLLEAQGQVNTLKARLQQLVNGSRPEEVSRAKADLGQAQADLENAKVTLQRTRGLFEQGIMARQAQDDAQAKFDSQTARVASLQRSYDLIHLGPRAEEIDATRAQVQQAEGSLAYAQTQLDNTVIRAPVSGTILERNVEKGEFVTTGFVGDKGAKGYVVSLADLDDLQVELDINQNDFAKLDARQPANVTTDAYPDRKYQGRIDEISPEANRQKATVQVKVKILAPDPYLRPEMNATVAFYSSAKVEMGRSIRNVPVIILPASAVRDSTVYLVVGDKAIRRSVKAAGVSSQGVRIGDGLIGGEDVIVHPSADLKDGQKVRPKA